MRTAVMYPLALALLLVLLWLAMLAQVTATSESPWDVRMPQANGIQLEFEAQLGGAEGGLVPSTAQTRVTSAPILSLDKSDGVNTAYAGDLLTYTLTYTNAGDENASNVTITDTLPNHVTYVGCEIQNGDCHPVPPAGPDYVVFHIPAITQTIGQAYLVVRVNDPLPAGASVVSNQASMAHSSLSVPADVYDIDVIGTQPDLQITVSNQPELFSPGKLMTYTVIYSNVGRMDAEDVVIATTLPTNTVYIGYGWQPAGGQTYTRTVTHLPAGSTGHMVTFTVQYSAPVQSGCPQIGVSEFNTPFTIAGKGGVGRDTNSADNTAIAYIGVPDLVVTEFTVEPSPVEANVPVTFTIVMKNQGTGWALNPDFQTGKAGSSVDIFISPVASCPWKRYGDKGMWDYIPAIAPGVQYTLVMTLTGGSNSNRQRISFTEEEIQQIQDFYVKVDSFGDCPYGLIPESNEMNNVKMAQATFLMAQFTATPTSGPAPLMVNFADQSIGDITSWHWDFGDGNTSSTRNPLHTYERTDTYTVSLTISGPDDSDTETKPSYIQVTGDQVTGDAYEPDDTCTQANTLATDGTVQPHTFHQYADVDWAHFTAISGTTYVVQATSISSGADLTLELYDACDGNLAGSDDNAFGSDARIIFTAPSSGTYYLKVLNDDPAVYGPHVTYELSVRTQMPGGVALIVAGHDDNYRLQDHILYAANFAYRTFLNAGIPKARIRYLSTVNDSRTDADGDEISDVYASSTSANVQAAITTWAANLTDNHTPFYLYLADHGGVDVFLTNGSGDTLTPNELDVWLSALETATGASVNVVYEACHSGSFIVTPDEISEPGRVVIASTGQANNAYPAPGRGAYFSDAFFTALGQSQDLWTSFQEGVDAVEATGLWQTPWLDANGNAVPNEPDDRAPARGRGLANPGFPPERPPVVDWVLPPVSIQNGEGTVRALVRDDGNTARVNVWAVVYPPSFIEPAPSPDGTMPDLGLPQVELSDSNGDGEFVGVCQNFTEDGIYHLVFYAEDGEGNLSQPTVLEVQTRWQVHLPLVMRGR